MLFYNTDVPLVNHYYTPLVYKDEPCLAMSSLRVPSVGEIKHVLKCLQYDVESGQLYEKVKEKMKELLVLRRR